ncbi:hypothetical protein HGB25_01525 [Candidatus Saccharibacteria bacterium]|nr:hypothetical protein [Candidatus Saccharibacteria bacterium]
MEGPRLIDEHKPVQPVIQPFESDPAGSKVYDIDKLRSRARFRLSLVAIAFVSFTINEVLATVVPWWALGLVYLYPLIYGFIMFSFILCLNSLHDLLSQKKQSLGQGYDNHKKQDRAMAIIYIILVVVLVSYYVLGLVIKQVTVNRVNSEIQQTIEEYKK